MKNKNKIKSHSKLDLESSTRAVSQRQHPTWKTLNQVQGDVLSYNSNNGFTLIELLVVVLIIGILAAVALPQYQKAVEKSRATQALTLLKSFAQAAENYYLANGEFPTSFDALAVDLDGWSGHSKIFKVQITDAKSNGKWSAVIGGPDIKAFHIGQLTGKYQGAGFSYVFSTKYNAIPTQEFLCSEFEGQSDAPFNLNAGDYCQKLFHGTQVYQVAGQDRYFRVPSL